MFGFFFSSRRRHTRWPRDWSSDVCSSDLTDGLGLDKVGIETDEKGFIPVNDELRTQVNNIYAIGDVVEIGRASVGKECRSGWWQERRMRRERKGSNTSGK